MASSIISIGPLVIIKTFTDILTPKLFTISQCCEYICISVYEFQDAIHENTYQKLTPEVSTTTERGACFHPTVG